LNFIQAFILGVVQGATEFIPVSSSGHLLLVPWLLGWDAPGLTFSVAAHLGTMVAVLFYFRRDWINILGGSLRAVFARDWQDSNLRMLILLIIGSIPAGVLGLLFEDFFAKVFEEPLIAALMLIVTALLLLVGDRIGQQRRGMDNLRWPDGVIIGLAQALAIVPGISRSGATIATGRMRELRRDTAARFSFLLSTPVIFGAGILQTVDLLTGGLNNISLVPLVVGFLAAMISGYIVINWLLTFLKTRSTDIFAGYCIVAAIFSLIVIVIRGGA
jgi:undecaprenyl-diphosphatase